jgi:thiamine biosynthesis lipoprotein
MKSSEIAFRRCRPLLGTFVEVSLWGASVPTLRQSTEHAYRAIDAVVASMSFHDQGSELSRLNRTPVGEWINASEALREVLSVALDLQIRSHGQFNVARSASWGDLCGAGFEISGDRVRRILPVMIDLGGIAKGYAVDCAVREIRRSCRGISGVVNAGGDIQVFGRRGQQVHVRSGNALRPRLRVVKLKNGAIATSSSGSSLYIDIRNRRSLRTAKTATAFADRCVIADALTKVALFMSKREAAEIAAHYDAQVSLLA